MILRQFAHYRPVENTYPHQVYKYIAVRQYYCPLIIEFYCDNCGKQDIIRYCPLLRCSADTVYLCKQCHSQIKEYPIIVYETIKIIGRVLCSDIAQHILKYLT